MRKYLIGTLLCIQILIITWFFNYEEWGDGSEQDHEPQEVDVPLDCRLRRRRTKP